MRPSKTTSYHGISSISEDVGSNLVFPVSSVIGYLSIIHHHRMMPKITVTNCSDADFSWRVRDSNTYSSCLQTFFSNHISGYKPCSNAFKHMTSAPWSFYDRPRVSVYPTSYTFVFSFDMGLVLWGLFCFSADTPGIFFSLFEFVYKSLKQYCLSFCFWDQSPWLSFQIRLPWSFGCQYQVCLWPWWLFSIRARPNVIIAFYNRNCSSIVVVFTLRFRTWTIRYWVSTTLIIPGHLYVGMNYQVRWSVHCLDIVGSFVGKSFNCLVGKRPSHIWAVSRQGLFNRKTCQAGIRLTGRINNNIVWARVFANNPFVSYVFLWPPFVSKLFNYTRYRYSSLNLKPYSHYFIDSSLYYIGLFTSKTTHHQFGHVLMFVLDLNIRLNAV